MGSIDCAPAPLSSSMTDTAIPPSLRRTTMAWNKPKLTEIPVSMEINMYACAKRK